MPLWVLLRCACDLAKAEVLKEAGVNSWWKIFHCKPYTKMCICIQYIYIYVYIYTYMYTIYIYIIYILYIYIYTHAYYVHIVYVYYVHIVIIRYVLPKGSGLSLVLHEQISPQRVFHLIAMWEPYHPHHPPLQLPIHPVHWKILFVLGSGRLRPHHRPCLGPRGTAPWRSLRLCEPLYSAGGRAVVFEIWDSKRKSSESLTWSAKQLILIGFNAENADHCWILGRSNFQTNPYRPGGSHIYTN